MEPSAAPQIVNTIPVKELRPQPDPALPLDNRQRPAQIEEIVVTATKRAEPVRKIAGTVNVLSGEDLEREGVQGRSEEHTSELQSLMRISYAVFCLKKKTPT